MVAAVEALLCRSLCVSLGIKVREAESQGEAGRRDRRRQGGEGWRNVRDADNFLFCGALLLLLQNAGVWRPS